MQQLEDVLPAPCAQSGSPVGGDVFHCLCAAAALIYIITYELPSRTHTESCSGCSIGETLPLWWQRNMAFLIPGATLRG